MNRASSEMLHSSATDVTVLERLRARMKWRRQRHGGYDGSLSSVLMMQENLVEGFEDLMASGLPELGKYHEMAGVGFQSSGLVMSRSSPASVKSRDTMASVHMSSFKKRKANKEEKTKVVAEKAESKEKRVKLREEEEEESKIITEQNSTKSKETFTDTSKLASSEVQKTDYIHVRARRGQATDSHSLAERARREKISERMKYLQSLVPGCNKIIGKAGMLDEIINYVQSLQQQVEFLSMKLAAVNPRLDELFLKQENQQGFPAIGVSSEMTNSSFVDRLTMDESMVSCCLSSVPETLTIDSASFTEEFQPYSEWDVDLQSIYNVNFEEGPFSNFQ